MHRSERTTGSWGRRIEDWSGLELLDLIQVGFMKQGRVQLVCVGTAPLTDDLFCFQRSPAALTLEHQYCPQLIFQFIWSFSDGCLLCLLPAPSRPTPWVTHHPASAPLFSAIGCQKRDLRTPLIPRVLWPVPEVPAANTRQCAIPSVHLHLHWTHSLQF